MSNISWENSYLGQLRALVGHRKLIHPSIRAIIQDEKGRVLFIERKGENKWGLPAGSMELDETIFETLKREVKEETGINVRNATVIAIYTSPEKSTKNKFGDEYQMFEFLFFVNEWDGDIERETDESVNAKFFPINEVPKGSNDFWDAHQKEVLEDFIKFNGIPTLK